MIANIIGQVVSNNGPELVLMTAGGVGYKIFVDSSRSDRWSVGSEAQLLTYLVVREDALELFGFGVENERQLFLKLLSVSGIGPKSALHTLSLGEVTEINSAIARGDVEYLTKVSGIGRKTAERIVVELKSKMVSVNKIMDNSSAKIAEAIEGLIALGYTAANAREAVKDLSDELPTELIIREALKKFNK